MAIEIVFETHSWSEDNDRGVATGWLPGRLSGRGEALARELGDRRRHEGFQAIFASDLRRAAQTVAIAFEGSNVPVLLDWRLRECDYGDLNGMPSSEVHRAVTGLHDRYPSGESWLEAMRRVGCVLDDLTPRWDGCRLLMVGHIATLWGLAHRIDRVPLEDIRGVSDPWREGWYFSFDPTSSTTTERLA